MYPTEFTSVPSAPNDIECKFIKNTCVIFDVLPEQTSHQGTQYCQCYCCLLTSSLVARWRGVFLLHDDVTSCRHLTMPPFSLCIIPHKFLCKYIYFFQYFSFMSVFNLYLHLLEKTYFCFSLYFVFPRHSLKFNLEARTYAGGSSAYFAEYIIFCFCFFLKVIFHFSGITDVIRSSDVAKYKMKCITGCLEELVSMKKKQKF